MYICIYIILSIPTFHDQARYFKADLLLLYAV